MRRTGAIAAAIFCCGLIAAAGAERLGTTPDAHSEDEPSEPQPATLTVGPLHIAADARLTVTNLDVDVTADRVSYAYAFANKGPGGLDLAASVDLPEMAASADDSETFAVPFHDPRNPVGLTIAVGGATVSPKTEVHAYAVGVDRLGEIETAHLPLLPFGHETEAAIAGLAPDVAARLTADGIIAPRDPEHPDDPPSAAWSLDVTQVFRAVLPSAKTTRITVDFTPVKAVLDLKKGGDLSVEDIKDDFCVSSQTLAALRSRLKDGGQWQVTEIAVDLDAPSDWLDAPDPELSVRKPAPDAIVAFCGANEKTLGLPVVKGSLPDDDDDETELHVAIFRPVGK